MNVLTSYRSAESEAQRLSLVHPGATYFVNWAHDGGWDVSTVQQLDYQPCWVRGVATSAGELLPQCDGLIVMTSQPAPLE